MGGKKLKITRDFFTNYVYLESRIKSIKRRLRYFETHPLTTEHGIVKGSMNRFPYTECHFVVSGVRSKSREERENAVNQLVTDLKRNECVFEDMKLDIESFLENTEVLTMGEQTVLRLKYVDGFTDEQIGDELGYDRSTISRKIDKIVKKCDVAHHSQY